jgi:hypothetical protein
MVHYIIFNSNKVPNIEIYTGAHSLIRRKLVLLNHKNAPVHINDITKPVSINGINTSVL